MSEQASEAKVLANEPTLVEIAGRKLELRPMVLRTALRVKEIAEPFVVEMATGEVNVTRLMMRHATRMFDMVSLMLGDPAWVESLDEDQFEELLSHCLTVNQSFFVRWALAVGRADLAEKARELSMRLGAQTPTSPTPSGTTDGLTP